ncbi:hypothetical protein [Nocardia lasii]|uniref:Deoxyxylulose-5-phosphate synthase n=1 Tax=Nocardia lasii TaxID=1616107 RepID=A0ABW1JTQ0_9NOCA
MCTYGLMQYKLHYACVACRVSFKRFQPSADTAHRCPRCAAQMQCAGHDFAAPRRIDSRAWSVVGAVLDAGLRYEGFEPCGCGHEPKSRPRSRARLRARRAHAARHGIPLAEALALPGV